MKVHWGKVFSSSVLFGFLCLGQETSPPLLDPMATTALQLGPSMNLGCVHPPYQTTIFYENKVNFNYTGGKIILSSTPDGKGFLSTDDEVKITVTRPDGSTKVFNYIFGYPKHWDYVESIPPQDVTHLFAIGLNKVFIQYIDNSICAGSTAYYLVVEGKEMAEWTVMIYANGDNNLETPILELINEIETVGSTSSVNIVALVDRHPEHDSSDGNWHNTRFYYITKDDDLKAIKSEYIDYGEQNMGAPQALLELITRTQSEYRAKHYLLIFADHGDGWRGVCIDDSSAKDALTMPEIINVFEATDFFADLVIFETCLSSMIEVAYQLKDCADFMIGHEYKIFSFWWDPAPCQGLVNMLKYLTEKPNTSVQQLAEIYINETSRVYRFALQPMTVSVLNLSYMEKLGKSIDELVTLLIDAMDYYRRPVTYARENAWEFDDSFFIDLDDFLNECQLRIDDKEVITKIHAVKQALEKVVFRKWNNIAVRFPHCGLSIYFPTREEYLKYQFEFDNYRGLNFSLVHRWDDFLYNFLNPDKANEHTYGQHEGWYLVSVPSFGDIAACFGTTLYHWNGTHYEVLEGNATLFPNHGYWARLPPNKTVRISGKIPTTDQILNLGRTGWHMISTAWVYPKEKIVVIRDGISKSWADAVSAGWILDAIWGYEPSSGYTAVTTLNPWLGYWIKTKVHNISLKFTYSLRLSTYVYTNSFTTQIVDEFPPEMPNIPNIFNNQFQIASVPSIVTDVNTVTFKVVSPRATLATEIRIKVYDLTGKLVGKALHTDLHSYGKLQIWMAFH